MTATVLVTGGAGFIGSNFIRYLLEGQSGYRVVNLDNLTYAGNLENVSTVAGRSDYRFVRGDICNAKLVESVLAEGVDAIVNFAAETHVDRSIADPSLFVRTNLSGTHVLLERAYKLGIPKFIQVSTDEVYGSLGPVGAFTEQSPIAPNSPYSATKAGADMLVMAYYRTYEMPVMITRCSNNYGPYQHPEKLIPFFISRALQGQPLPIYGDGLNIRDWLFVTDHCAAIERVLRLGVPGEVYNIGGGVEMTNLEITRLILRLLDRPESLITFVADRRGHDRRYAIDGSKMARELGWIPSHSFEQALTTTVRWYEEHQDWFFRVVSRV